LDEPTPCQSKWNLRIKRNRLPEAALMALVLRVGRLWSVWLCNVLFLQLWRTGQTLWNSPFRHSFCHHALWWYAENSWKIHRRVPIPRVPAWFPKLTQNPCLWHGQIPL